MSEETLDKDQVAKAVHALFQYVEKQEKSDRGFLGEGEDVFMQLTFKKIPDVNNQIIKIPLPTSLMRESSDACLFVKDLDKNKRDFAPTVEHYKDLLERKGVKNVAEVIPLKMLKIEYQPFEAKRNLSNMYEFYLADERIYRLLPTLLGKNFYGRKRHPLTVDLQVTDLKEEINQALNSTRLIIGGRGGCSQMTVAHTAMNEDQVVENILAVFEHLKDKLPEGMANIKRLHLRMQSSPAIPFFDSPGSANDIVPKSRKRKVEESAPEEISTLMDKKIKITPDGVITFFTMDGQPLVEEVREKSTPDRKRSSKSTAKKGNKKGPAAPKPAGSLNEDKAEKAAPQVKEPPKVTVQKRKGGKQSKISTDVAEKVPQKAAPKILQPQKKTKAVKTAKSAKLKENTASKNRLAKRKPKVKKMKVQQ